MYFSYVTFWNAFDYVCRENNIILPEQLKRKDTFLKQSQLKDI